MDKNYQIYALVQTGIGLIRTCQDMYSVNLKIFKKMIWLLLHFFETQAPGEHVAETIRDPLNSVPKH
jgi:hypothetical protein